MNAPAAVASAPGRVNLIGEHTDYSGGYVLPTAIPQRTSVALAWRGDGEVRVVSDRAGAPEAYVLGEERPVGRWIDYIAGVTRVLGRERLPLRGFHAEIRSEIPLGSGLSSSAALTVAVLRALRSGLALDLDDLSLAQLARRVETDFVGAPVGPMDPMACHFCDEGTALFLDTRSLRFERVPLPASAEVVVVSSGVSHRHATGEYRARRAECDRAREALGVASLRELCASDVPRAMRLPDPLGRRVRHVITENARVLRAVQALRREDVGTFGALLGESHLSLRDDYEVSIEAIDRLVAIAARQEGVLGARLTGGGFGGSIVALARRGLGRAAGEATAVEYAALGFGTPRVLVPCPAAEPE